LISPISFISVSFFHLSLLRRPPRSTLFPYTTPSDLAPSGDFRTEERKVIFASSLGTVFEWYDFYLYAVLAPFFAALFFPPGNQTDRKSTRLNSSPISRMPSSA